MSKVDGDRVFEIKGGTSPEEELSFRCGAGIISYIGHVVEALITSLVLELVIMLFTKIFHTTPETNNTAFIFAFVTIMTWKRRK